MACDALLVSNLLIETCKGVFDGLESLVDDAGGTGSMAKAFAKSFPQMEFIVFDLPHVVNDLQGSNNLNYVGGDMFQEIPQGHVILLKEKFTVMNWNAMDYAHVNQRTLSTYKVLESRVMSFLLWCESSQKYLIVTVF
ncbi:hypothetical protein KIW84_021711 [Lathyrus oleraceus]|uniref:O-methyltransferase C-terminal domain-containing protein n=1 Tax=Pisum sativum TaxID=3888 RepID=A0A9D4Y8J4_PEA|nr:hypothetical protein KIW84_021711 [Pisum sativum]